MIQFRIEIQEQKNGKVSIEARVAVNKETATELEHKVTAQLHGTVKLILEDITKMVPGSSFAGTSEDAETMRGMEDLDIDGDMN